MNVDVAIGDCYSYLSFIARNWQGHVVDLSVSKSNIIIPEVAKVKAILLAL